MTHSSKSYFTSLLPMTVESMSFDLRDRHVESMRVTPQVVTSIKAKSIGQVHLLDEPYSLECPSLKKMIIQNTLCYRSYDSKLKSCQSCKLNTDCKNARS